MLWIKIYFNLRGHSRSLSTLSSYQKCNNREEHSLFLPIVLTFWYILCPNPMPGVFAWAQLLCGGLRFRTLWPLGLATFNFLLGLQIQEFGCIPHHRQLSPRPSIGILVRDAFHLGSSSPRIHLEHVQFSGSSKLVFESVTFGRPMARTSLLCFFST